MTPRTLRLIAALAATALATPAAAQHHKGMHMPGMAMPKKAAPKKAVPKKAAPKKAVAKRASARKAAPPKRRPPAKAKPAAADPHAGHDMSAMPNAATPPAVDPHAGHDMPAAPAAPAGTDLPAGNAPPPPLPTDHAADAVYGAGAMAMGRHHLDTMHGAQQVAEVDIHRAEVQVRRGRTGYAWDGEVSYGGDLDRLRLTSEGEGEVGGGVERAEVEALYSRAIGPYFNLHGGLRYDVKPDPSRVYATLGVKGLAPYFIEVEGALFLSNKGEFLARAEASHDQRITQRLILQSRAEVTLAAQDTRATRTGAGLSEAEFGLRLRYDLKREFAPYVGVQYERAFGRTRAYRRADGEDAGGFSLLAGIKLNF